MEWKNIPLVRHNAASKSKSLEITKQNKTKQKQNLFHPIVEHRATDQARLLNLSLTGAPYRSAHRSRPLLIP